MNELSAYARGLEFALAFGALIMLVAVSVAVPLGTLAASGPRVCDSALRFVSDSVSALPTVFVAAVLWAWAGHTTTYVGALGVLRGLQQAWLLRCEIVRLEAEDPDAAQRSLGQTPLRAFLRLRLPIALGPLLVNAAFSVAWLSAVDAALTLAGLRPRSAPDTWGTVLAFPSRAPLAAALAVCTIALVTVAFQTLFRRERAN